MSHMPVHSWAAFITGLDFGLGLLHAWFADLVSYRSNQGVDSIISTLTQYSASTRIWELVTTTHMPWDKYLTDYGWANIGVKPSHSIPFLSCALFILIWDLLRIASCDNKNFTMRRHLSSFQVFCLVLDPPVTGTLPCVKLYFTPGTLPHVKLSVRK